MKTIIDVKKDKWTEDKILALPAGESDRFDRKGGLFLSDSGFEEKIAKALSAFSNSGGGHLVIGVKDDGTFDGVNEFHKGRSKTREWLEQKIPYLLVPVLQDFRVHEVEKTTQTLIPQDKVIIVIDVGDSSLAPHQSNKDYHYYYRAGGHSKPAPHQYLEFLWKRESYPGPQIASAWVYKVINPLLNIFESELKYVSNRNLEFDKYRPKSLKGLQTILTSYNAGNYEQFYEFYPDTYKLIQNHDEMTAALIEDVEKYYLTLKDSDGMQKIFKDKSSLKALEKLKNDEYSEWNREIRECNTIEDFHQKMFSNLKEFEIKEILAQYVINGHSKVFHNAFAPFWNVYSNDFLWLYSLDCDEKFSFENTRSNMAKIAEQLIKELKQERSALCSKYQIPFEESQQIIIHNQGYNSFLRY